MHARKSSVESSHKKIMWYAESRKLKEHERIYATHDLELVVIIHVLKDVETLPHGKEI
jgi:hypothetical protein